MTKAAKFAPAARADLREALVWLARTDENAARNLRIAISQAARRIAEHPEIGRSQPRLLPPRYRVWSIPGFPYLLIYEATRGVPCIARIVHTARDLPAALQDLIQPPDR